MKQPELEWPESKLVAEVRKYAESKGVMTIKIAGGARQVSGLSDLFLVIPPTGWLVTMELKAPAVPCRPTPKQAAFLDKAAKHGAFAVTCNSMDSAKEVIDVAIMLSEKLQKGLELLLSTEMREPIAEAERPSQYQQSSVDLLR